MLSRFPKWAPPMVFGAALFILCLTHQAQGQVRVMPSVGNQPAASTRIGGAQAAASQITQGGNRPIGGVNYRGPVGGYYPRAAGVAYPGYGTPYVADPYGGYLNGAANVINSQGEYMKTQQEALQMQEKYKQEKLETRKKTFEEWQYEQNALPTAEELRAKKEKADIDWARGNPPLTMIRSGDALNTLLTNIQKSHSTGSFGPTVLLQPETLRYINVTDGRSNTGTGLLGNGGKLEWPYPLQSEFFDTNRKKVDQLLPQAVTEARSGRVSFKVIKDLESTEDALRADLKTHIHDLTPSQGVEARRYINDLHETFRTLQDPNVSKYVGGAWSAKGDQVGALVDNMTREGLKFAPAAEGSDSYYRSLYNSMVTYDRGLPQLAAAQKQPPQK